MAREIQLGKLRKRESFSRIQEVLDILQEEVAG